MTSHESQSRVARRGRVLAGVGVVAALAVGGLAYAGSSNAAPPNPAGSLSVTISGLSANTVNDGTSGWNPVNTGTVNIKNLTGQQIKADPGTNFAIITSITGITAPLTQQMFNGLSNTAITNTVGGGTFTTLGNSALGIPCAGNSFCNGVGITGNIFHALNLTGDVGIQLDTRSLTTQGVTGTFAFGVDVVEIDTSTPTAHLVKSLGSASFTSTLAPAAAPTLAAIPGGTVNQAYSATAVTSPGFPAAPDVNQGSAGNPSDTLNIPVELGNPHPFQHYDAGYKVYAHHTNGSFTVVAPVGGPVGVTYPLKDGLTFDPATGKVTATEYQTSLGDPTVDSYTIVVNNGVGGAVDPIAGNLSAGVIPIQSHDVSGVISLSVTFSDVPASYPFSTAIYTLANDGILQGFANGTFLPGQNVSRQAFAHFAAEYLNFASGSTHVGVGACSVNHPSPFVDVSITSQFCAEVRDLSEAGIINGYAGNKFLPTAPITRQAEAAMLFRIHENYLGIDQNGAQDPTVTTAPFTDVPVTNVFAGDIAFLKSSGITTGYADGSFHPTESVSRGATAQFIYKLGVFDLIF
jgi:hypothetical protein